MSNPRARIAVIGAGIGGLAAAIALRRHGFHVDVYEQARQFRRVGAAINLTPNAVRVLDGLGLADAIRRTAHRPLYRISRTWDTGAVTSNVELGAAAEKKYGAPLLTLHRADLLAAIEAQVPADRVHLGRKLVAFEQDEREARLRFADGSNASADIVIGADGIHSTIREALFGPEAPRFTGAVAFRSIVPAARLAQYELRSFTKWWGPHPHSQIVTFLIDSGREFFVFATIAQPEWQQESWSVEGDIEELRAGFVGYHPEARAIIEACDHTLKTALYERDPLPAWTQGRATLLGDACHPMMPFMAQGAAMGLEDAAVLARCVEGASSEDIASALARYEATRRERTSRMQLGSRENQWLKHGVDPDWVYGYDAWLTPLAA